MIDPTPHTFMMSGKTKVEDRHPDDPSLTWAGRGVKPNWLKKLKADGHNAEEYRIRDTPAG
jgi:DNA-binding protein H-NS